MNWRKTLEELKVKEEGTAPSPWFVVENDLMGGFSAATVDKPASAIDFRSGGEHLLLDLGYEKETRLCVSLRNSAIPALEAAQAECDRLRAALRQINDIDSGERTERIGDPYDFEHGYRDYEFVGPCAEIARGALNPEEKDLS